MIRIAVIFSLFVAACDVGSALPNGQGPTPDSAGSGSAKMDAPGAVAPHNHTSPLQAGNPTNAGQGCLAANCHNVATHAANAPAFGFAGTVYTGPAASMGNPNIMVKVGTLTAVSDAAGNFYTYTTTVTYPVNTSAGSSNMSGQINTGDCNSSGCHQFPGGAQTPINTMN